jgi:GxxExxY protein
MGDRNFAYCKELLDDVLTIDEGLICSTILKVYNENALVVELRERGHEVEQQREFPVHYKGHFIGKLIPDLIVDQKVIADPKVVSGFDDNHIAQMIGYLAKTDLQLALLLNFKYAKLRWKRIVREI